NCEIFGRAWNWLGICLSSSGGLNRTGSNRIEISRVFRLHLSAPKNLQDYQHSSLGPGGSQARYLSRSRRRRGRAAPQVRGDPRTLRRHLQRYRGRTPSPVSTRAKDASLAYAPRVFAAEKGGVGIKRFEQAVGRLAGLVDDSWPQKEA